MNRRTDETELVNSRLKNNSYKVEFIAYMSIDSASTKLHKQFAHNSLVLLFFGHQNTLLLFFLNFKTVEQKLYSILLTINPHTYKYTKPSGKSKKTFYNRLSIHCDRAWTCVFFTLHICRVISWMKAGFQDLNVGCTLSKIAAFSKISYNSQFRLSYLALQPYYHSLNTKAITVSSIPKYCDGRGE